MAKDKTIEFFETYVDKTYSKKMVAQYENEKYFYRHWQYKEFHPRLLWYDDVECKLRIERCTPMLEIEDNKVYRDRLWKLLEDLHKAGVNHRDVSLINVVVRESDDEVLLIDWESATENISDLSIDLCGCVRAGLTHPWRNLGPDGIWWNGPWGECPGRFWDGV